MRSPCTGILKNSHTWEPVGVAAKTILWGFHINFSLKKSLPGSHISHVSEAVLLTNWPIAHGSHDMDWFLSV